MDSDITIWWEQKPDIYNQMKPRWYGEAGDMQADFDDEIKLK